MTLNEFYESAPYLYHLTSQENLKSILSNRTIYSTKEILNQCSLDNEGKEKLLKEKREGHAYVTINGVEFMIRDQKPISIKALNRTLTDNWSSSQFLESLNSRIFFWPSLDRLLIHFKKYEDEKPKIIRVEAKSLVELNINRLRLCHLNSGATRCHPKWKGPPPRGANTFAKIVDFEFPVKKIAEVTFEKICVLPEGLSVSNSPDGPWKTL